MFAGIRIAIKDILFYSQFWGLWAALKIRFFTKFTSILYRDDYSKRVDIALQRELRKEFQDIVLRYQSRQSEHAQPITDESPIWVCWWQGEAQMPEMIKQCYRFLQKNSNGHHVVLITQDNYGDYIDLPERILEKVSNKSIAFAFLSDIIRTSLLAKHGGLWIDSTYWVTQPLAINGYRFFSIRQSRFSGGIANYRWAPSCLGTGASWYVLEFIRDCLLTHLQLHPTNVTYLLIDQVINIAYEEFPEFRTLIDSLPDTKEHIYIMPWLFNQKLDETNMKSVVDSSPMLKLSIKQDYSRKTQEGDSTYYDYFMAL